MGAGEADQELHPDLAGGQIGVAGIADHQILENLGAEADPLDLIAGLDAAPGQLPVDIVGGDIDPQRPKHGEGDQQQDEQHSGGDAEPPRPAPPSLDHDARFVHFCLPYVKAPSFLRFA